MKEINKMQSYKITTLRTDYLASYVIYISSIGPRHRPGLGAGISTAIIFWPLANVRIEFANVRPGQYKSKAAGGAELTSVPVSAGAEFCILSFGVQSAGNELVSKLERRESLRSASVQCCCRVS